MAIRVTQIPIETSIAPNDSKVRVTQAVVETSIAPNDSKVHITQIAVETSISVSNVYQLTAFDTDAEYQIPFPAYQGIQQDPNSELFTATNKTPPIAASDIILMDYKGYAVAPSLRVAFDDFAFILRRPQPRTWITIYNASQLGTGGGGGGTGSLPMTTTIQAQTGHNTSASAAYNKTNNGPDFTGTTWLNTSGSTASVNSAVEDDSYNAITPCHVSPVSVKTLIPNYSGKWYAHVVPWFGQSNHANIGVNCNTTAWVQASTLDQQARGFDGIIIDWYGQGDFTDTVTLKLQTQIATMSGFTYAIMIDQGSYSTTAGLVTELNYVKSQYFGTTNYQTQGGLPVLLFFGTVSGVDYSSAFTSAGLTPGSNVYTIFQGPGSLSNSYTNACFDWVQPYGSGVPGGDPYNTTDTNSFLTSVHSSAKGSIPCISPGFNGYVTGVAEFGYKKGYLIPRDAGKCWLTQAATVNANLPTNIIGIQVPTFNDWEEGSEIESAIDNSIVITASVAGTILSWSYSGGTGDETTISSYTIIATLNGITAAIVGTQNAGGSHTFDLSTVTGWGTNSYTLYVIAVGIPCVRSQTSNPVTYNT